MLEAAEIFENKSDLIKSETPGKSALTDSCNKKKVDFNTTMVSQDVLQMCENYEKNNFEFSSKKKKSVAKSDYNLIGMEKKENNSKDTPSSSKKKLDYSFGDQTLRNILNTQNDETTTTTTTEPTVPKNTQLLNRLKKSTDLHNIKLNLVQTQDEFDRLISSLKPKEIVSLSLACENRCINENEDDNKNEDTFGFDENKRFLGVFLCFDSVKQKEINFLLFKASDQIFSTCLRIILEREDIVKILFFAKKTLQTY
jgi:hypothetical protein